MGTSEYLERLDLCEWGRDDAWTLPACDVNDVWWRMAVDHSGEIAEVDYVECDDIDVLEVA